MSETTDLTVRKSIDVKAPPDRAFDVFTNGIAKWWPPKGHSIGEERVADIVCEARAGGLVYEVLDDGTRHEWADVAVYDPPNRMAWNWRVNPERSATRVDITFSAIAGGTRVELVHSGWDDADACASYDAGWDGLLAVYATAV